MVLDYDYYGYPRIISAKLGDEKSKAFQLNKETAKDMYFLIGCNTALFRKEEGMNFYQTSFQIETLLSWNEEYILAKIEEIKQNYYNGFTIVTFVEMVNTLSKILVTYVKNKDVLKKVIDFLEFVIDNVGCFIFFKIYGNGIDEHTLCWLWESLLFRHDLDSIFTVNNLTSITKFHNADAKGFIPNLLYQEYYDLLNDFVKRVLYKIMKKYDEKSKIMTQLELRNGDTFKSNKEELDFYISYIRKYFKEHNVSIEL